MREGWGIKKIKDICDKGSSSIAQNKIVDCDGNYPVYGASGYIKNIDFYHQQKPYIGVIKDGSGVGRVNIYPAYSSLLGTMQYITPKDGYLLNYVAYALKSLNLASFASGAAIPHIYFKDYGECKIPGPPLPEQQKIVEELDCLSNMIELKKKQLETYDKLAQSIFYDMFGDPIINEKGWKTIKIKDAVKQMHIGPFGSALKTDCYVSKDNAFCMVYEQKHAIKKSLQQDNHYINREKYYSLKRFEVRGGDIIMSCRGTIGEIYRLPINAPIGIIHPSLMKIRLNEDIFSFIYFVRLLDMIVKREDTNGGCVQMAITAKALGEKDVPYPSMNIQQQFAEKIGAIEKQKDLIKQTLKSLEELFNSRMDYYFN